MLCLVMPPDSTPVSVSSYEIRRLLRLEEAINSHSIVSATDARGRITYVNRRFCEVSGFDPPELLGQNHRLLKSGLHGAEFYREMWARLLSGKVWQGEICNRRKDGQLYWVDASIVPIFNEPGEITEFVSVRTDISAIKQAELRAQIAEERFRRSQNFANIGTWDWNIQTGELFWTERIAPLFGYPQGELETTYENFLRAVHPDDREALIAAVDACVNRGADYHIEHRCVWPDGQIRWLLECGGVIRDEFGVPQHMLGVVQDITDRKQAELDLARSRDALRESEQRFRSAFKHAAHGMALVNRDGLVEKANPPLYRLLGRDEADLRSCRVDDLVNAQDLAELRLRTAALRAGSSDSAHQQIRCIKADGQLVWTHASVGAVRDSSGELAHFVIQVEDVSARKLAEERLALFRRLVESSAEGIVVIDDSHRVIYFNDAARRIFDFAPDHRHGRLFYEVIPDHAAAARYEILAHLEQDRPWSGRVPVRVLSGRDMVLDASFGFIPRQDGEARHVFCIFRDHSDEVRRAEELARAYREAEKANRAKSEFLSRMSHELRTPMNAIMGFTQLLQMDPSLDEAQRDEVGEILKASRHLLALINEVLDLSRIEAGSLQMSLETVGCFDVMQDVHSMMLPLAHERGLILSLKVDESLAVRADRTRLRQALINLLSNAIKYNRPDGRVVLSARSLESEARIRLQVDDTGPGISPEDMKRLFQPFTRLIEDPALVEGTGIGLTITQRLVNLMEGEIGVESRVGKGSSFWIDLPARECDQALESGGAELENSQTLSGARRLLYIEDNPANQKLVASILAREPGIELTLASSALEGIEQAKRQLPALILLDINLPGMDGYRALAELKRDARLAAVPVVAVTANAMPADVERARVTGFAAHVSKPIGVADFLDKIRGLLIGARP